MFKNFINNSKNKSQIHSINITFLKYNGIKSSFSTTVIKRKDPEETATKWIEAFIGAKELQSDKEVWSTSFEGVAKKPFDKEIINILLAPIETSEIEIKPDGLIYLPEIKYRRILNRAFGPGGWGLVPRGPTSVSAKCLSREYALFCLGQFTAQARGEQDYFDKEDISMSSEGARSNALTRCCKDLGIASELWDPIFIKEFKKRNCELVWVEHIPSKRKRQLWRIVGNSFEYPYRESTFKNPNSD